MIIDEVPSWKADIMRGVAARVHAVMTGHPSILDFRSQREQLAEAANKAVPKEACGFILAQGTVVECTNIDEAPWYRYKIDEDEAAAWWETGLVIAVWHSHPTGPAVPSEVDAELAPPGVEAWVYSVEDEDLGIYHKDERGQLALVRMESPE